MDNVNIPFFAHEQEMVRMDRVNKRTWILCVILILALIGSNAGWIYYESQFETAETTTITQELDASDGGDAIINDGVHIYGESEADSQNH